MSFPKAPLKRFNEAPTCAPPPGSYDVKPSDPSKGPVSFDKSRRFRKQAGEAETRNPCILKPLPSPGTVRKLQSLCSKPNCSGMKLEKDFMKRQKELEKEIRVLVGERGQLDKRLQAQEEDLAKSESKLTAVVREKTSLLANVASLEKQLLELSKTNELLKTKFSEDGTQKKMSNLCLELMKLRNRMNAKKMSHTKPENMETKLETVQRTVEHPKEKVAQQEELTATEKQPEEKCDSEKLLEYIAELGNVAEQVDKYKLDISQLEEAIEAKDRELEALQSSLELKEAMLSAQINELHDKCKMFEQQKEKLLLEHEEKELSVNAEIEHLKEKLNLEERERQKQEELCQEASAAMHQKFLEYQDEVTKEKQLLEKELKETMEELDKLHTKEEEVEKLLKHLEQENKSQAEELAQMEAKLEGKAKELETAAESHSTAVLKMQEEHSNALCKLGETIAEFEKMLLDAQKKLALKDAEIERIGESNIAQIANLQARLEEQSEHLKKELEMERKTIEEKVKTDYRENMETWRILYEDLYNKVKPFQQQLDAYEAEKNALLNEHGAAQEELNKLSDAYAKLLGHQNQKQKIKHVMKLKEENVQLKQEVLRLRSHLIREKQCREELQDQLDKIQGVRRFDPSKAFQHSAKENVAPKTPFKEGNSNKS
ncbi:hyaluronan mediated motility receptor isoform X4 [Tiliqua scincoides]|uniref:hyaluronan mediated motility receptor isoform X4 n=1 Tax=Tiliqua scincoides TaxID=71010 RepID=UPI003461DD7F